MDYEISWLGRVGVLKRIVRCAVQADLASLEADIAREEGAPNGRILARNAHRRQNVRGIHLTAYHQFCSLDCVAVYDLSAIVL
jgi:hypothetical protein